MTTQHHRHKGNSNLHRAWLRGVWLALALAGCGGDVDTGGTGASTSYASGPITGFGSVILNGVRFDDTSANVTDDDGGQRNRGELRLGMTAEIRGSSITTDSAGANISTASTIAFGSDILGGVESIDVPGKQLVVLGQPVDVNLSTVFDDTSIVGGLPALAVGNVVEVYGLFNATTGRYTATRIERKTTATAYRLRGVVSNLNTGTREFNLGTVRVSYAGVAGAVPPSLANGALVRVRLQTASVGGVWPAVSLNDGVQHPREHDDVRLEGVVNTFTSSSQFSVNGVAVDASGVAPAAGLALGARVEVEGTSRSGVLVAAKVKVKSSGDVDNQQFELRGAITSVDALNLRFVLRGATVSWLPTTDFRDGTAANLLPGANVEARGTLSSDGARLLAARISFK